MERGHYLIEHAREYSGIGICNFSDTLSAMPKKTKVMRAQQILYICVCVYIICEALASRFCLDSTWNLSSRYIEHYSEKEKKGMHLWKKVYRQIGN